MYTHMHTWGWYICFACKVYCATKTSIQCKIKNTGSGFDRAHTSFLIRILWLKCDMREDSKKKKNGET